MFESLSEKFQHVFKTLRGEAKLTEENMAEALREIRLALLEADVQLQVVKQLLENVRTKCQGQEVWNSFSPSQQVVKIVRDELIELLGGTTSKLKFSARIPSVFLMAGLQGSGKTTTTGKLARWLQRGGHHPLLVSVDVYRPAAREQLAVVGREVRVPVFSGTKEMKPLELALAARDEARNKGCDALLIDTAGRLHVDEELMAELVELRDRLEPTEILFVADAMTGQDAVRSAEEFHRHLGVTGVVLTKLDGDARGGAALSVRSVIGQPIKFVGTGEKLDNLELFHPDRMASRILGMGDVLTLIEKAEEAVDRKQAEEMVRKLQTNRFSLEDFREQIQQAKKMGPLSQVMAMLPTAGAFRNLPKEDVDDGSLVRVEAIINSMTARERVRPEILNGSRRKRIARGSGTTVQEVNQLLKQYDQMRRMMRSMTGRFSKRLMKQYSASLPGA